MDEPLAIDRILSPPAGGVDPPDSAAQTHVLPAGRLRPDCEADGPTSRRGAASSFGLLPTIRFGYGLPHERAIPDRLRRARARAV